MYRTEQVLASDGPVCAPRVFPGRRGIDRAVEPVASFAYTSGRDPVAVTLLNADGSPALATRIARDRQGNVTSVDNGRGKAELTYNKSDYPISVKDPLGNVSRICYNAFNAPASVTDANGIVTKYAYNDAGLVTRRKRLDGSETLTTLGLAYDTVHWISKMWK